MQIYKYDRVIINEGITDDETGENLSGLSGVVEEVGYRSDEYPISVNIYNEETGFFRELKFKPEELEVVL